MAGISFPGSVFISGGIIRFVMSQLRKRMLNREGRKGDARARHVIDKHSIILELAGQ